MKVKGGEDRLKYPGFKQSAVSGVEGRCPNASCEVGLRSIQISVNSSNYHRYRQFPDESLDLNSRKFPACYLRSVTRSLKASVLKSWKLFFATVVAVKCELYILLRSVPQLSFLTPGQCLFWGQLFLMFLNECPFAVVIRVVVCTSQFRVVHQKPARVNICVTQATVVIVWRGPTRFSKLKTFPSPHLIILIRCV
jgi:hypothetical protein